MWGKGLLSSTVRGFCLHEVSTVWVSKRDGIAFLVLCFSRWADALCLHNGRRERASSHEMTLCEGETGIKLRLAITNGNCSAGDWAGRWDSHGKAWRDQSWHPNIYIQKPYWKQVQWSVDCLTPGKGCSAVSCGGLSVQWWLISAVPLCRRTQAWSCGGTLKSGWKLQFSPWLRTEAGTEAMHRHPPFSPGSPV